MRGAGLREAERGKQEPQVAEQCEMPATQRHAAKARPKNFLIHIFLILPIRRFDAQVTDWHCCFRFAGIASKPCQKALNSAGQRRFKLSGLPVIGW